MPKSGKAGLLRVVEDVEPVGDADMTHLRMTEWSKGQKVCRMRGRHNWKKWQDRVHGTDVNRPGTIITRIQMCPDCKNRREADHMVIALRFNKDSRGLRKLEKWVMVYREVDGVPYLLDKGSQRVTEELREEMIGADFFADTSKVIYVDDDA